MREYFAEAKWKQLFTASNTQEKWDIFMEIYNEGVSRYVPKIKIKEVKKKKDWFNIRYITARKEKEAAWNRWRKKEEVRNGKNSRRQETNISES